MPRLDSVKIPKSATLNPFRLDTFGKHAELAEKKMKLSFSLTQPDTNILSDKLEHNNSSHELDFDGQLYSQPDSKPHSQLSSQLHSQPDEKISHSQQSSQLFSQQSSQLHSQPNSKPHSQQSSQLHCQQNTPFNLKNYIIHLPAKEYETLWIIMRLICNTGTLSTYEIMQNRDIAKPLGKTRQQVFKEVGSLIKKKLLYKDDSRRGNGGITVFSCSQEFKSLWIECFLNKPHSQQSSQLHSQPNSKPHSQQSSQPEREEEEIFNNIKNSSSNISDYLKVYRNDFEWLDENRIKQIMNFGNCSPDELQDVLDKIRFAKQSGEWEKSWKVQNEPAFVMNAIKETGTIYIPKDYISPKLKLQREQIERLRAEAEEIKKLDEEAKELGFYLWGKKLSDDDLKEIYTSNSEFNHLVNKININSKIQNSLLREYYFENIYLK